MNKKLIISGKTENEIMQQIIDMNLESKTLKEVLKDYENSTGLDSLKNNMGKYFDVE